MDTISKTTDVSKFPEIDYSLPPMDKIFIDSVSYFREEMKNSNNAKKANTKMRFFIPAQQRAVDPSEIYFQLNVAARTNGDTELGEADKQSIRLAEGGVHSLFREMIIKEDGRGNIIEKINDYNLITKILQDTLLTKEVKDNLLNVEGVYSDYDLRNSIHTKVAIPMVVVLLLYN